MYGTGTKKMLNILILDILKEYSDSDHRLLQQDIIDLLKMDYGMDCERRAVKSNIVSLQEMGYDIVSDKGYYLRTREFTDAELRLLIDSIFTSGAITDKEAHQLANKLENSLISILRHMFLTSIPRPVGRIPRIQVLWIQ